MRGGSATKIGRLLGYEAVIIFRLHLFVGVLLFNAHFERLNGLLYARFSKNGPLADSFIESRCQFICLSVCLSLFYVIF